MNLLGGSQSYRFFKIVSFNNHKYQDDGRYKTKGSPANAAKKAFSQLSKKKKIKKLTLTIKETTQGSSKKEYGPYRCEKVKLKKPIEVKYKGKNKPVLMKTKTVIHLVKKSKQKGGSNAEVQWDKWCKARGISNLPTLSQTVGQHTFTFDNLKIGNRYYFEYGNYPGHSLVKGKCVITTITYDISSEFRMWVKMNGQQSNSKEDLSLYIEFIYDYSDWSIIHGFGNNIDKFQSNQ
jgi:hypothetical protein